MFPLVWTWPAHLKHVALNAIAMAIDFRWGMVLRIAQASKPGESRGKAVGKKKTPKVIAEK